jgi:hypothetical protein
VHEMDTEHLAVPSEMWSGLKRRRLNTAAFYRVQLGFTIVCSAEINSTGNNAIRS